MKKINVILLTLFIVLSVILNFIPHLNYSYPLHVDEWVHFQYSNHLSDNTPLYFGGEYASLEAGFHYLLATLNSLGVSYLFMFNFFASLVTILICLGVFILTRRLFNETAGVFSVLFIAMLKSSVAILGPVFFVPMAVGLFFIVIGLYLVHINSKLWTLILASILIIHPPTAMAFLLLINIEFIILAVNKKQNFLKNLFYEIIAGIIALPLYLSKFLSEGAATINNLNFTIISSALFVPRYLGWVVVILALVGIYFSSEKKKYSTIIYTLTLLVFIFVFYHYEIEVFIPYRRALMYLFLVLAVVFGYGCERIINLSKDKRVKIVIGVLLIIIVLFTTLPSKLESNDYFYHIIDEKDFQAFSFIKENTPKDSIAVLDFWKANAFTCIAEREVYSRIVQGPSEIYEARNSEIEAFFDNKCNDTDFLVRNNISIVYGEFSNDDLEEVYPDVWIRK